MRHSAVLILGIALLAAVACGTTAAPGEPASAGPIPVLSPAAVPGLPYTTTALSARELSQDASIPGIASMLASWGYTRGAERTFQGESRHLTLVVSRTLEFRNVLGATSYVSFVHSNATAFFGIGTVTAIDAQGRSGWEFSPQACACHLANPVVAGVVNSGSNVTWLEINGPDATPALLLTLLDPANSGPATS